MSSKKVKMLGYWSGYGESKKYPDPRNLIKDNWDAKEKSQIVEYLRKGHFLRGFWDYAPCRFIEDPPREDMGSKEFTDGVYAWPEGLSIYVDEYNVALPESFINHVVNSNFLIPEDLNTEDLEVDLDFWKNWSLTYS